MAVNRNIKWNPSYEDMTTVSVLTMGQRNNYNLVWSFPFEQWHTMKGYLHGTVTDVLDGDTIRMRLSYTNPFSYPVKKVLSLREEDFVTENITLIAANRDASPSEIELRPGAEVTVRLSGINTPEKINYDYSASRSYKLDSNKSYLSKLGVNNQSDSNMEKIARVAEEAANLVNQISINSEVFVLLDTQTTTTSYSPGNLSGAHAFSLDNYGRFLGEIYIIPSGPYAPSQDSRYKWILLNATLVSNNSVYETFNATIAPPIKSTEDGAIPLGLIIGDFLVDSKSSPGETSHGVMDLNSSINPLEWYKYVPDYADRVDRMNKEKESRSKQAAEVKQNIEKEYRVKFDENGILKDDVEKFWQDPSDKAETFRSLKDAEGNEVPDPYFTRNLVPAESEEENYEDLTVDDRDLLDGIRFEYSEKLKKKINVGFCGPFYCRIGDCTLPIPPTNINVYLSSDTRSVQALRSKSPLKTQLGRIEKYITMTLFFADGDMIDGYPMVYNESKKRYTTPKISNSEEREIWYRNGLRPLIAQIEHAPFLPVENEYLNETHKIYNLVFEEISVKTVEGFPHSLMAEITFREFDHTVFMPQEEYFAGTFCWPLFRWWYQRFMQQDFARETGRSFLMPITDYDSENKKKKINTEIVRFSTISEEVLQTRQYAIEQLNRRIHPDIWGKTLSKKTSPSGARADFIEKYNFGLRQYERFVRIHTKYSGLKKQYPYLWAGAEKAFKEKDWDNMNFGFPSSMYSSEIHDEFLSFLSENQEEHKKYFEAAKEIIESIYNINDPSTNESEPVVFIMPGVDELTEFMLNTTNGRIAHQWLDDYLNTIGVTEDVSIGIWEDPRDSDYKIITFDNQIYKNVVAHIDGKNLILQEKIGKICLKLYDQKVIGQIKSYGGEMIVDLLKQREENIPQAYINLKENYYEKVFKDWAVFNPTNKFIAEYISNTLESQVIEYGFYSYEEETNRFLALSHMLESDMPQKEVAGIGPDLILTEVGVLIKNKLTPLHLLSGDTSAYQYIGASEKKVTFNFQTVSRQQISILVDLFRNSQRMAKDYRVALVSSVVKIYHPLLQLFGSQDILFDDISIETVSPEVFSIKIDVSIFDKTQRKKEDLEAAAVKLNGKDVSGYDFRSFEDFSNLWEKGTYSSRKRNDSNFDYGSIDLHTKNMEVYPDLELPTYDEINYALPYLNIFYKSPATSRTPSQNINLGRVKFTTYPNRTNCKFVDPDFYIRCEETFVDYIRLLLGDNADPEEEDDFRSYLLLKDNMGGQAVHQTPTVGHMSGKDSMKYNPITLSDATEKFLKEDLKTVYYGRALDESKTKTTIYSQSNEIPEYQSEASAISLGSEITPSNFTSNDPIKDSLFKSGFSTDTRTLLDSFFEIMKEPTLEEFKNFDLCSENNIEKIKEIFYKNPAEDDIRGMIMYFVERLAPNIPKDYQVTEDKFRSQNMGSRTVTPEGITQEKLSNIILACIKARYPNNEMTPFVTETKGQNQFELLPVIYSDAGYDPASRSLMVELNGENLENSRIGISQLRSNSPLGGYMGLREIKMAAWFWPYSLYIACRSFIMLYEYLYLLLESVLEGDSARDLFEDEGDLFVLDRVKLKGKILDWTIYYYGQITENKNIRSYSDLDLSELSELSSIRMPMDIQEPARKYYSDVFHLYAKAVISKYGGHTYDSFHPYHASKAIMQNLKSDIKTTELDDKKAEEIMRAKRDEMSKDYNAIVSLYKKIISTDIIDTTNLPAVGGEAGGRALAGKLLEQRDQGEWNILRRIAEDKDISRIFNVLDTSIAIKPVFSRKTDAGAGFFLLPSNFLNIPTDYNRRHYSVPASVTKLDRQIINVLSDVWEKDRNGRYPYGNLSIGNMLIVDPMGLAETWYDNNYSIKEDYLMIERAYSSLYSNRLTLHQKDNQEAIRYLQILEELCALSTSRQFFHVIATIYSGYISLKYEMKNGEEKLLGSLTDDYYLSIKDHPLWRTLLQIIDKDTIPDMQFKYEGNKLYISVRSTISTGNEKNSYTYGEYINLEDLFELRTYSSDQLNETTSIPDIDVQITTKDKYEEEIFAPKLTIPTANAYKKSWNDILEYDKRGRLLRAFPTFQMYLINEGKWIAWQKLWDNFYGYNSVVSIDLVKDRRIAADTLVMQLTNIYHNLSSYDTELSYGEWEFNMMWLWQAITDHHSVAFSALTGLLNDIDMINAAKNEINSLMLRPGARIHLKMGYGSDASSLPVVFNGTITELDSQEIITLVAQGDGLELTNKFNASPNETTKPARSILVNGAEPREYICGMLSGQKGFLATLVNRAVDGMFFSDNVLGLRHFGANNLASLKELWGHWLPDIFEGWGELGENVHTGNGYDQKSSWKYSTGTGYAFNSAWEFSNGICPIRRKDQEPRVAILLYDKTAWDVIQVFSAVCPDYIASVIPFEYRSSLFFGKPWFSCTTRYDYQYKWNDEWNIIERKLINKNISSFSQFRVYNSYTDIVGNSVYATEQHIYTNVIGIYGRDGNKQTRMIQIDSDIYPDKQKTSYVRLPLDSNDILTATGDILFNPYGTRKAHAESAAVTSLRDFAKEMYQGELIVLGDPSTKPYDTGFMADKYTGMDGMFWIKRVVHSFSAENGFISSITPDLVSIIDDKEALNYYGWFAGTIKNAIAVVTGRVVAARLWKKLWYGPAGAIARGLTGNAKAYLVSSAIGKLKGLNSYEMAALSMIGETGNVRWDLMTNVISGADDAAAVGAKIFSTNDTSQEIINAILNNPDEFKKFANKWNLDINAAEFKSRYNRIINGSGNIDAELIKSIGDTHTRSTDWNRFLTGNTDTDLFYDLTAFFKKMQSNPRNVIDTAIDSSMDALTKLIKGNPGVTDDVVANTLQESLEKILKKSVAADASADLAKESMIKAIRANFTDLSDDAIREITGRITTRLNTHGASKLDDVFYAKLAKEIIGDNASTGIFAVAFKAAKERIVKGVQIGWIRKGSNLITNKLTRFLLKKTTGTIVGLARGLSKLVGYLGPQAIITIVMDVAFTVIIGSLAEMLSRALRYRQALILMPLRYRGKDFVAGIDGHAGAVVGDDPSAIDKFLAGTGFMSGFVNTFYTILGVNAPDYSTEDTYSTVEKALYNNDGPDLLTPIQIYPSQSSSSSSITPTQTAEKYRNWSVRSPSGITAEQIDRVIEAIFNNKKASDPNKETVLLNSGKYFIEAEAQYNINAVFLAAVACAESGWGTSSRALETNNVGGIKHGSNFATYNNVGDSIKNIGSLINGPTYNGGTIFDIAKRYCNYNDNGITWVNLITSVMETFYKRMT